MSRHHLDKLCRDALSNVEQVLELTEEELIVTMEGILHYNVLQQGT